MVRRESLAVLKANKKENISETGKAIPTKIGVHASPWSEREFWLNLKVVISSKLERPCPLKLVCMHLTSIPTCMNFLSQFQLIEFLTTMDIVRGPKGKFSQI